MRPTIRDVTRKLNLSITTVSRALDGYDDVAEEIYTIQVNPNWFTVVTASAVDFQEKSD
jgi:hypothetical protein